MEESAALALSRRWWDEMWGDGNLEVAHELFADPFVRHSAVGTLVTSVAAYRALFADFQRTLLRPRTTIDDRAIAGDRVWTRATSRGINRETGEPTVVTWLIVQRVVDGRIAEQWSLTARDVDWSS